MAANLDDLVGKTPDDLDTTLVYQPRSFATDTTGTETSPSIETDEVDPDDIHVEIFVDVEVQPSKFETAAKQLLNQKEATFSDWLDEMENKWDKDCPLALEDARKIKDSKVTDLSKFGEKFNPVIKTILGGDPVIPEKPGRKKETRKPRTPIFLYLGTSEMQEFKKRLEIACKSFHGVGKDLDAIGKLMESKQQENKQLRLKLKNCFEAFELLYKELGTEVQELLALDDNTLQVISKHKQLLDDDSCPIVVAGQVSSGKSSLLNLFLSAGGRQPESSPSDGKCTFTLPVSTLACTGRICEISYNTEISAKLYQDKSSTLTTIDITELSKHVDMYGQEESYKSEENIRDVVKLGLPIPFLKGGVTLVDTPGVGENVKDSEIVRNYIAKNNVFGFIFTIHTSAGSGVNLKFQQLLRDLSKYEDDNGNKKLDPEAVIFVCNFWDQIKPEERESTTKRVLEILEATGFMKDFDANKQLLFMNSKGAFDTWKVGYMSEDYNKLTDAMERFFEVGHKRKVLQSYVWFHSLLQRVLRSVKFLQFWAQDIGPNNKSMFAEKLEEKLRKIKKAHGRDINKLRNELPKSAEKLAERLLEHLKDKKKDVFNFTRNDILNLEAEHDNVEIRELKMDMLIDSQIGNLLNEWEAKQKLVLKQKKKLENGISFVANFFDSRLSEFERRSVSIDKFKEGFEAMDKKKYQNAKELVDNIAGLAMDKTDMDIAFGRTYGNVVMKGCSLKQRAALAGNSIITDFAKIKNKGRLSMLPRQAMAWFKEYNDFSSYLNYRADTILSELTHKSVLTKIMLGHLTPVEELIDSVDEAIDGRIRQNQKLIQVMKSELVNMMATREKRRHFFQRSATIQEIFSRLLRLGYEADLEAMVFGSQNLAEPSTTSLSCGRYGSLYNAIASDDVSQASLTLVQSGDMVSVKVTRNFLTESEQFFLMRHLRKINEDEPTLHAPRFLGLSERGYGLTFYGMLTTAKNYFINKRKHLLLKKYRQEVAEFLLKLADGLHYLHYKELVHPEVSVESVLVQVMDHEPVKPMLTHIAEKGSLNISFQEKEKIGNLIYLPYECVQGPSGPGDRDELKSWYTSAGDMYGLGTVIVELFYRTEDLFERLKSTVFEKWQSKSDPGNALLFASRHDLKVKDLSLPEEWNLLCKKCLESTPEKRITADKWITEWVSLKEMEHMKKANVLSTLTETKDHPINFEEHTM